MTEKDVDNKVYLTAGDGNFSGDMSPQKIQIWKLTIQRPIADCIEGSITGDECLEALASLLGTSVLELVALLTKLTVISECKLNLKTYTDCETHVLKSIQL
jgi:hypothetical protein